MAAPSLSLERAATLRAELDLSDRPDDVLAREGLTRLAWEAVLEKLLVELADDIDRGEVEGPSGSLPRTMRRVQRAWGRPRPSHGRRLRRSRLPMPMHRARRSTTSIPTRLR